MACGGISGSSSLEDCLKTNQDKTNFTRLTRLLICGGTVVFRELFDSIISPTKLVNALMISKTKLQQLKTKRILTQPQWDLLYSPLGTAVESKSFDITLLFKLLREICGLTAPATGWDNLPNTTDITLEADLARIKYYRNEIYGHVTRMELSDRDFQNYWQEIKEAMVRLAQHTSGSSSALQFEETIKNYLGEPLTDEDERNGELLRTWYLEDMVIKETLLGNTTKLDKLAVDVCRILTVLGNVKKLDETSVPGTQIRQVTNIRYGETIFDCQCKIQALLADITCKNHAEQVLAELKKDQCGGAVWKMPTVWRIANVNSCEMYCHDDGEPFAGIMLFRLLEVTNINNLLVAVKLSSDGDVSLQSDRLHYIVKSALNLLQSDGLIRYLTSAEEVQILNILKTFLEAIKNYTLPEFELALEDIEPASKIEIFSEDVIEDRENKFQVHLNSMKFNDQVEQLPSDVPEMGRYNFSTEEVFLELPNARDEQYGTELQATKGDETAKEEEKLAHGFQEAKITSDFDFDTFDGDIFEDGENKFQAHLAVITSKDQVEQVLVELKKKYPDVVEATHNIWAYRIFDAEKNAYFENCDDDGDDTSGARVLRFLQRTEATDVMVVVSCCYETTADDLGPVRFKFIQKSVLDLILACGIVELQTSKIKKYFEEIKYTPFEKVKEKETPKFEILHGQPIEDRKSTFQGHLAEITSREQVDQVLAELKKDRKIAKAKYNMWACRIYDEKKKSYLEDGNDDGEHLGAERLLHLLRRGDAKNVVVIVSRWHGGIHLGTDRFKHINKCAVDLLQSSGNIKSKGCNTTKPRAVTSKINRECNH